MLRTGGSNWLVLTLAAVLLLATGQATAADDSSVAIPGGLPAPTEPDTVRTNLWLTEALMGEIVTTASASMPSGSHAVKLVDLGGAEEDEVFSGVAVKILDAQGHDLFVSAQDSTLIVPVDYVFGFKVIGVELSYPEVGRTLGIWQRWIARDLLVSASVEISDAESGQLLFKEILERRFTDRVDNDDFDAVGTDLYDFTTAEKAGSGWQNRMEEIVVLGTLVALIAVYFANTGN